MIETSATVLLQRGDRADQPAANTVVAGTLYCVVDEGLILEQAIWFAIVSSSIANPTEIETSTAHGLTDGDTVVIFGHSGSTPDINGSHTVTVVDDTHFTIAVNVTADGTGGKGAAWVSHSPSTGTGDVVGPAEAVDSEVALFNSTTGKLLKRASGTGRPKLTSGVLSLAAVDLASEVTGTLPSTNLPTAAKTRAITFAIDGGGSALSTGIKADVYVPYACTITAVTLLADQAGDVVVDIWKDSLANYPPTDADSITASAPPTLSSAASGQDATLSGWTTAISAGDTLRFNIDSASTITRLALTLTVTV